MNTNDISTLGLVFAFASLFISTLSYLYTKAGLLKELLISMGRMSVQLFFVGLYLTWLFELNNPYVNIGYIFLMMSAANFSVLRNSGLRLNMFWYTLPAITVAVGATLAYFMLLVFKPTPLFDARYLIPIAGMLLGNSMNRTIVTLERFYTSVKNDEEGYSALVTIGATVSEATSSYLKTAYRTGLAPVLANLATMGIVSLPGMMTGQILGGSNPFVAIKYQVAIILAIYVATDASSMLCIILSRLKGFNQYGFLNNSIFK